MPSAVVYSPLARRFLDQGNRIKNLEISGAWSGGFPAPDPCVPVFSTPWIAEDTDHGRALSSLRPQPNFLPRRYEEHEEFGTLLYSRGDTLAWTRATRSRRKASSSALSLAHGDPWKGNPRCPFATRIAVFGRKRTAPNCADDSRRLPSAHSNSPFGEIEWHDSILFGLRPTAASGFLKASDIGPIFPATPRLHGWGIGARLPGFGRWPGWKVCGCPRSIRARPGYIRSSPGKTESESRLR